ncbi:MAG: hypothetical protein KAY50_00485 [Chitinophagaceae bacterium]|nr:hypothetical protein [Chitinophagaceae bacterium]
MSDIEVQASPPPYFPGFKMYDEPPVGFTKESYQNHLCRSAIMYAIHRYNNLRNYQLSKINQLYNSFNGLINETQYMYINQTYGKDNLVRYKDYRLGRMKMELLTGEWLTRERFNKISSINPDAETSLYNDFSFQVGLKHAAPELNKLRQNGVNVLPGMEPMQMDDEDIFDLLSSKRKSTVVMQYLLDKGISTEMLWTKLANTFTDQAIASEAFFKTEIDSAGYARAREIDPREALFEESDRDPFLQRTPYIGERRLQFVHDIIAQVGLTQEEYKRLNSEMETARSQTLATGTQMRRNGFQYLNKQLAIETWSIEWMAVKPLFIIEKPDKIGGSHKKQLSDKYYNENRSQIEKDVKKGKYKIHSYPFAYVWEASLYGRDIFKGMREKPNQIRDNSNPFLCEYSYSGLLFRTHDGVRISIFNTLDHVSELYNITMLHIRRELNKAKGKGIAYDRAFLPEGKQIEDVISRMINDGVIDIDSSTDKAQFAGGAVLANMLKEFDLGLSNNFQQLVALKQELERTTDVLTGISNSRQGNTPASMTATNAVNQIQVSRTSTEYLFHMHHEFCKKVVKKFMKCLQLSYGYYHQDEAKTLLGDKAAMFLDQIKSLPLEMFDLEITDGRKETEIRQMMQQWFPQAINSGEMRVVDAMEASLAGTIDEAVGIAKRGWELIKKNEAENAQANNQAKSEQMMQVQAMQKENLDEERKFKAFMEMLKYLLESGKITQQAMNEYTIMAEQLMGAGQPAQAQTAQIQ